MVRLVIWDATVPIMMSLWCSDKPLTGLTLNLVGEPIRVGVGVHFCWIFTISWPLIGWAVFMDCSWIADEIDLKLGGWSHWGTLQTWVMLRWICAVCLLLVDQFVYFSTYSWPDWPQTYWMNLIRELPRPDKTFIHAPLNSCCFLASDWSSSYGIPQAWFTWVHVPLNSIFLEFDWFIFHAFTYKPLDGLTSNLVDELLIGIHWPDKLLVPLC